MGVFSFKISILPQKLVIICATRTGAHLGVLEFKINVLRQELVNICATLAGENFCDLFVPLLRSKSAV